MALRTFQEAVVLVTGGASGIGKSMAVEMAKRGAKLVLADRDLALAEETAGIVSGSAVECDVTDAAQVEKVVTETWDREGRIDYFFNNAGIAITGEVRDNTLDHWRRVLDVNLYGVVYGVHAVYPKMIEQGFGHIVNTASMAGLLPTPMFASYGASKHAVVGLSKALRVEARPYGVRVSALCPGFIRTPILDGGKYGERLFQLSAEEQERSKERLRPMDPDAFARKAIDAIAKNEGQIILPSIYKRLWALHRYFPRVGNAMARRMHKEMQSKIGEN